MFTTLGRGAYSKTTPSCSWGVSAWDSLAGNPMAGPATRLQPGSGGRVGRAFSDPLNGKGNARVLEWAIVPPLSRSIESPDVCRHKERNYRRVPPAESIGWNIENSWISGTLKTWPGSVADRMESIGLGIAAIATIILTELSI
jgi:hypothetical protein